MLFWIGVYLKLDTFAASFTVNQGQLNYIESGDYKPQLINETLRKDLKNSNIPSKTALLELGYKVSNKIYPGETQGLPRCLIRTTVNLFRRALHTHTNCQHQELRKVFSRFNVILNYIFLDLAPLIGT